MRQPDSQPHTSAPLSGVFHSSPASAGPPSASAHLRVRQLTADDESSFVSISKASFQFHQKWIKLPTDSSAFKQYLARLNNETTFAFVICRDEAIVGVISLTGVEREPYNRGRLGYGTFEQYVNMGYMTFGLKHVIRWGFDDLGLHRLEADIQPGNEPSKRLAGKMGFTCEGVSRGFIHIDGSWLDHERWSLTLDKWHKVDNRHTKSNT